MTAHSIEEPAWSPVAQLEAVEIRQYEPVIQARTAIGQEGRSTSGFRTLADYIFGGNAREQSIAMTAPVEELLAERDAYMAFTMPAEYGLEELPEPTDGQVTLHPVPARTMAVVSFSGWARSAVVARKTRLLFETLEGSDWEPVGSPSLNQYNPPWTPPWSRRNEVTVEVRPVN
ncbi:MAG: heme-binding protein [Halioglobus sp.]|nr:heme-binding protein [Halioglobus sp.]